MQIAIDASRTTVARLTGTERYALRLVRGFIEQTTEHHFMLYFRDAPPPDLFPTAPHVTQTVIPFPRMWTHLRFAAQLYTNRPDITFVPSHTLPLLFPGRAAVTVHDLGFRHFPNAHPPRQRLYLDWSTRHSANRADVVLADSAATAHDLTHFYDTPPEKIHIVYPGVDVPPVGDVEAARRKYNLPHRYFLFLGTLQPRKNIARLVQAYARFRANADDDVQLVLAGGQGWLFDPAWVEGVDGVHLPGFVDDEDKGAIYTGAIALVFPSLYEGFGFPVLEAMGCGTPVLCSNTSSLPELAGDAALLVDPLDVDTIADAMTRIVTDTALRETLRQRGHEQVAKFTWQNTTSAALNAFDAVQ